MNTSDILLVGEFDSKVFGYVAYSKPLNTIVIAFRGTRTYYGWIRNLRFAKPDCPFANAPEDAKVHLGFLEAWFYLRVEVLDHLEKLTKLYPQSHLLITGHSLGGAISTLAMADIYNSTTPLDVKSWNVVTYGQPRVGNRPFVDWLSTFSDVDYSRIVNENDPVPHLPPAFVGFQHVPEEIWINGNETYVCPVDTEGAESKGIGLYSI